jgi:membrane protease YdiL (CAAX protease family)
MLPRKTARLEAYTTCAKDHCELWRTGLGVLLMATVLGIIYASLSVVAKTIGEWVQLGAGYALAFELITFSSKRAVLILLFAIALALPALWLVVRLLHHRSLKSLIAPTGRLHWANYRRAAVFALAFGLLTSLPVLYSGAYSQHLPLMVWLPWVLPALAAVFLQTATEELFFRGYLMQQLAARFKSRWVWWLLPALLFGARHYNPLLYGDNWALAVAFATLMGLIYGDITARSGDLSIAMGLHFANNLMVVLFLNVSGQLSALSLFLKNFSARNTDPMRAELLTSFAASLAVYIIYMLIMRARR